MFKKIKRVREMGLDEILLFMEAFCWVAVVSARLCSFRSLMKDGLSTARQKNPSVSKARKIFRAIRRAANCFPGRPICLVRATACCLMLRAHGLGGCLRIGVLHFGNDLQAHAWAECDVSNIDRDEQAAASEDSIPYAILLSPEERSKDR